MTCGLPSRFTDSFPGTALASTCNACCRNYRPISVTSIYREQRLCRLWRSPSAEPAKREFNSENVPKDEHNEPANERQHERGKAHANKAVERRPEKGATDGSFVMGSAPDAVGSTGLLEAERFCSTK
jgi:hypothetical protein